MVTTQKTGLRKSLVCPLKEEGKKKNLLLPVFSLCLPRGVQVSSGAFGKNGFFYKTW